MSEVLNFAMWTCLFLLENLILGVLCVMWGKAHPTVVSAIENKIEKVVGKSS